MPSSSTADATPNITPHLMPFHIKYSGPASLSTYFRVKDTTTTAATKPVPGPAKRTLEASFRGREMNGIEVGVPDGYIGVVLQSTQDGIKEMEMDDSKDKDNLEEERGKKELKTISRFDSVIFWNPGSFAVDLGKDEYLKGMLDWIPLSESIHQAD